MKWLIRWSQWPKAVFQYQKRCVVSVIAKGMPITVLIMFHLTLITLSSVGNELQLIKFVFNREKKLFNVNTK